MVQTAWIRDSFDVLFGNVRLQRVETDPLTGTLTLRAACAEGGEQKILYEGVLYSQIGSGSEGKRIAIAVELTPDELRGDRHQFPAARFRTDCGLRDLDVLEELNRCGYRLFSHFVGVHDELIVVARGLLVM